MRNGQRPWFIAYTIAEEPPEETLKCTAPSVDGTMNDVPPELYRWLPFSNGTILINIYQYYLHPKYGFNAAHFRTNSIAVSTG